HRQPARRVPLIGVWAASGSTSAEGGQVVEGGAAGVAGGGAEVGLDAQQLVVLGHALAAGGGAGLDLAGVGRDDQVGYRRVLGLAAAVRDDGGPTGALGELHRGER